MFEIKYTYLKVVPVIFCVKVLIFSMIIFYIFSLFKVWHLSVMDIFNVIIHVTFTKFNTMEPILQFHYPHLDIKSILCFLQYL